MVISSSGVAFSMAPELMPANGANTFTDNNASSALQAVIDSATAMARTIMMVRFIAVLLTVDLATVI